MLICVHLSRNRPIQRQRPIPYSPIGGIRASFSGPPNEMGGVLLALSHQS